MQTVFPEDDDIDREVDDIISQIKNQSKNINSPKNDFESEKITKEQMEEFIINNAANVVQQCSNVIEELRTEVIASLDPKIIDSFSTLAKATTSAIDSLTKLKIAEDKNKNQKEIAKLNLENNKKKDDDESPKGLTMSREDLMKYLTQGLNQDSTPET